MSDYAPELEMAFNFLAIICCIFWGIFGLVLYKIFKHPGVNRRLFTLTLGIVFAPFVYIGCLMIAEGLNLMVLVVFIAMLPFFALLIVQNVYFIIYYGLSFALLIVGYYLIRRRKASQSSIIDREQVSSKSCKY